MIGRLDERFLVGGLDKVEGSYDVIGQVEALLKPTEVESVIRVIREVPPTPKEIEVLEEAMSHFSEPSKDLGVEMSSADLSFSHPAGLLRPLAIYR